MAVAADGSAKSFCHQSCVEVEESIRCQSTATVNPAFEWLSWTTAMESWGAVGTLVYIQTGQDLEKKI